MQQAAGASPASLARPTAYQADPQPLQSPGSIDLSTTTGAEGAGTVDSPTLALMQPQLGKLGSMHEQLGSEAMLSPSSVDLSHGVDVSVSLSETEA